VSRPIEAVVFDMDGVLIDSEPIWHEVQREIFARVGITLTDEDLIRTMGVRIDQMVEEWYLRQPWESPTREEIAGAVVDGVATAIEERGAMVDGAVEAIERFGDLGLRLALATSSSYRLIRAVLAVGGLSDRFEVVHSAEEEERGKPDPAVYLTTARKLGIAPERCLAVEDSVSGVRSAKAAGMVCVAIPEDRSDGRFGEADAALDSIRELDERVWALTKTTPVPP
jgi:mannitol-1-/sugar-/sorbitol-6-/2-deoxyglucose-6-phosphatase